MSLENARSIDVSQLEDITQKLSRDKTYTLARNATTSNGIHKAARNNQVLREYHDTYSVTLPHTGNITDQKQSGRCWLFAAYNVVRERIMTNHHIKNIELSQAYGMFYDKFEKSNWFYETIIATADRPVSDRLVTEYLQTPASDGGFWQFATSLIKKYGVVPVEAMPETPSSENSNQLNTYLNRRLRTDAFVLRSAIEQGDTPQEIEALKSSMLASVYRLLATALGEPPTMFDFKVEFDKKEDKKGEKKEDINEDTEEEASSVNKDLICEYGITPQEFYDTYVGVELDNYVSVISVPGETRPFKTTYELDWTGNVVGGDVSRFLNMPIDVLKDAAISSLKDGRPVWMACDVMQNMIGRDEAVLDTNSLDTEALFDTSWTLDKATSYDYREISQTHAMTFQGVDIDQKGKPIAWRTENSWGEKIGNKGYLIITDNWFDTFVGEVVVELDRLPEEAQRIWRESTPTHLEYWDPIASLSD